jgi:aminopeptidase YwaD
MTIRKILSLIFFCLLCCAINAQDIQYARSQIKELTSPAMMGRGYIAKSQQYAAQYIAAQFQKSQLKPLGRQYMQQFDFPVNTFPQKISFSIDGKTLVPGKDYLVEEMSGSGSGKNKKTVFVDKDFFSDASQVAQLRDEAFVRENVFILDTAGCKEDDKQMVKFMVNGTFWKQLGKTPSCLVIVEHKKLTWSVSKSAMPYAIFTVKKEFLNKGVKNISYDVTNKLIPEFSTQNLAGYFNGTTPEDSFIVITGHYDHLGMMGDSVYFPGANDNTSGISMMLDFVKYYSQEKNRPKCKIAFVAFAGEEAGLVGSEYFVNNPMIPLNRIKFLINLDLVGTGDEGIMVVNATEHPAQFKMLEKINKDKKYFTNIGQRGKAHNSDHYWFTEKGVKCFFIYTLGGISAYHDIYDRAETLPLTKYDNLFRLIRDFVSEL